MKATTAFLVYLILTLALLGPLTIHLSTAIENDGDLSLGLWQITWIARKAFTEPGAIFDMPFYYPHEVSFPAGYHNYLLGFVYAPFYYLLGKPVAAYNILYITTLALNGLSMFLFVRYLTGSSFSGFISGIIFAFSPFRFGLYGFAAFQSTYWMPLSLLFITRYFDGEVRGKRGLFFLILGVLLYIFQFLTDTILGLYFAFVYFPYLGFMLLRYRKSIGRVIYLKLLCAVLSLILLVALINLPNLSRKSGEKMSIVRSLDEIQEISADVSSYIATPPSNLLYGHLTRNFWVHGMDFNFFGIAAYVLALCGLFKLESTGSNSYIGLAGDLFFPAPGLPRPLLAPLQASPLLSRAQDPLMAGNARPLLSHYHLRLRRRLPSCEACRHPEGSSGPAVLSYNNLHHS